jgi:hypothetical protein
MQPRSTVSLASTQSFFRPRIIWSTVLVLILAGGVMLPQTAIAQVATQTPPSDSGNANVKNSTSAIVDQVVN